MNKRNGDGAGETPQADSTESLSSRIRKPITRRDFLTLAGISGVWTLGLAIPAALSPQVVVAASEEPMQVETATLAQATFPPNAKGMIIGDPTRCTGCRRCELACTEFNDGKAAPAMSRIKVHRNQNFGPKGAQLGFWRGEGQFGDFLVIQDTCRQCAHPVPCQLACPNSAIEVVEPVNARVVNVSKCTGCRQCQAACPWGMTSFDEQLKKATKCTLCAGDPECVKACSVGALKYVPWQDRGRDVPARWVVPSYLTTPASASGTCVACHK